jgi:hypothetical protein
MYWRHKAKIQQPQEIISIANSEPLQFDFVIIDRPLSYVRIRASSNAVRGNFGRG